MVANVDKMMYVGEKPWHGEGTKLDRVATSAEAIAAAGLDWEVKKEPIYVSVNGEYKSVPGKYATVRNDRSIPLGVVGARYAPLQNKDAFRFFDSIVGVKEAMYHTAGSLGIGEKVWILAKLPGYIRIVKDDVVDKFLLLANSHDGSSAIEILFTPIRVVCQNTLNMAIKGLENGETARVKHTRSLMVKVDEVRNQLGIIKYQYDMFEQLSQKMVNIQINQEEFHKYLESIGVIVKNEEGKMSTKMVNTLDTLTELFEHGKGNDLPGVKGTLWAGYNAVVEHVDYVRGSDKKRAKSLLYGSGADIKQKAWDTAVALVG
jgi:phage/plasmid-like protein (TIGR03299 family)